MHPNGIASRVAILVCLANVACVQKHAFSICTSTIAKKLSACLVLYAGKQFSSVVAEAKALGYTEPDPREDLSGV